MLLTAVDTAVREQADEVKRVVPVDAAVHRLRKHGTPEQLAVPDALVDAGEVLVDDPAGAHVHVADLGVSHLSGRKSDSLARRNELRMRVAVQQAVVHGRSREGDSVVFFLRTKSPAVEDDEDEGGCGHWLPASRFQLPVVGPASGRANSNKGFQLLTARS